MGSAHAIWDALKHAADGQPPLFYLIEAHFGSLVRNPEIAFRIPSIFGFVCVLVFLFAFIRKRTSGGYALLCSALLLLTILFDTYAIEARPYSLEVACFALALLCYQHAPGARWMILMAVALALAENLHYYAIFALVPFGAAEIAYFWKTRRFRVGRLAGFSLRIAAAAVVVPAASRFDAHLRAASAGSGFSRPDFGDLRLDFCVAQ